MNSSPSFSSRASSNTSSSRLSRISRTAALPWEAHNHKKDAPNKINGFSCELTPLPPVQWPIRIFPLLNMILNKGMRRALCHEKQTLLHFLIYLSRTLISRMVGVRRPIGSLLSGSPGNCLVSPGQHSLAGSHATRPWSSSAYWYIWYYFISDQPKNSRDPGFGFVIKYIL